ncbi:uncharacterized protein RHOBADRAFT_55393 [Rhodotorula graminis WP1]|uniref:F-box domain-containing protein n=1 Tax=Rhodotorula graminis (strain WP1) TaxID=578459 RepID=A0A0P9FC00_RHOGW|nr:uncharacterized protein RHOBADRAFT_55393 [Rhodotorula graminis WP1]KPV73182.1 hypothetical protein RHOBADRAFT_55393 [Rhodotorula graminis WP1]
MPRPLPVELVDHILADESLEPADLARACLVSRSVFALARPRLYAGQVFWFNINENTSPSATRSWCSAIRASPQAAALVRHVQLEVYFHTGDKDFLADGDPIDLIADVLENCTNLEHFTVGAMKMPVAFLAVFPACASLRTFWNIPFTNDTYKALVDMPNLIHLALYFEGSTAGVDNVDPDGPTPSFHLETVHLESLNPVRGSLPLRRVLATVLGTSYASIRSLQINAAKDDVANLVSGTFSAVDFLWTGYQDAEHLDTILRACGSITTMQLSNQICHRWGAEPNLSSTFEVLPATLKTLHLDAITNWVVDDTMPTVVAVREILDALPAHLVVVVKLVVVVFIIELVVVEQLVGIGLVGTVDVKLVVRKLVVLKLVVFELVGLGLVGFGLVVVAPEADVTTLPEPATRESERG